MTHPIMRSVTLLCALMGTWGCEDTTPSTPEDAYTDPDAHLVDIDAQIEDAEPTDDEQVDAQPQAQPFVVVEPERPPQNTCELDDEDMVLDAFGIAEIILIRVEVTPIDTDQPDAQFTLSLPAAGGVDGTLSVPQRAGAYSVAFRAPVITINADGGVRIDTDEPHEQGATGFCAYGEDTFAPDANTCRVIAWMESETTHGLQAIILDERDHVMATVDLPTICRIEAGEPFGHERPLMTWRNKQSVDALIAMGAMNADEAPINPLAYDRSVYTATDDNQAMGTARMRTHPGTHLFSEADVRIRTLLEHQDGVTRHSIQ